MQQITVEVGYKDLGSCDTSVIAIYVHSYQLIPH